MAPTVPYVQNPSWADGSGGGTPITAAKLNTIEQGLTDAHLMPAVRVFHNANQSIANSTNTVLAFNSERFDTAGGASSTMHDTVTNNSRLTCRYAGKYQISGMVSFAANATGHRQVFVRLNGTTTIGVVTVGANAASGVTTDLTVSSLYDLAVNDYVELVVSQSSGGALNVLQAPNFSPEFMMARAA